MRSGSSSTAESKATGPITAVIADDEPFMREALKEQLQMLWPDLDIVAEAGDGPEALRMVTQTKPDIAFLDIRMPGLTGLQVAQLIPESTKIVFVTAYDAHALEAFDANAVDYVLKPLDPMRLAKMVTRLRKAAETDKRSDSGQSLLGPSNHEAVVRSLAAGASQDEEPSSDQDGGDGDRTQLRLEWLHVSVGQQVQMVHVDDVMFFESDTKYTRVVSSDCDGLIRTSLKELVGKLPFTFVQVHRGAVVNRRFIKSAHKVDDTLVLEIKGNPTKLKVSEANRSLFRAM